MPTNWLAAPRRSAIRPRSGPATPRPTISTAPSNPATAYDPVQPAIRNDIASGVPVMCSRPTNVQVSRPKARGTRASSR
ncbi:hypothetical protein [Actinocrispum wychmicini]|uniref:hypothetical protein n=1 Tax=Actinocrispum wychmicini TaxID=1213861 RepID=UPI001FB7BD75|nr:hypothetical protein [Actinocrispum wychmicini]